MKSYAETDADNARWDGFEFRPGDIVIAAPSKSGTTWTQLLVALLVFDGPEFPEPISKMSPWLEQKTRPTAEAHALLASQQHRRFIKSHTPLDGIPRHDEVRYVCVGRDPRDAAVSMLHHSENLNRERFSELIGVEMSGPAGTHAERLERWLDGGTFPDWSIRSLIDHYETFWLERHSENTALFHFQDYLDDLPNEIERLGAHIGIEVSKERAVELAEEASIDQARRRADEIVPEAHLGLFRNTANFLRSGRSGEGRQTLTGEQLVRYEEVVSATDPELHLWMHGGWSALSVD